MLTDRVCRTAKPREKLRKLSDGDGLQLWIQPTGSRQWRMAYRFLGKQKVFSIGPYPAVTLAEARKAREAARALLAKGLDPSLEKKRQKQEEEAKAVTFRMVAEEYLEKLRREGRADATMKKVKWLLGLAYDDLGDFPVAQIRPPDVLVSLRKVEAKGNFESARRLRSTIGSVMRYAVATARAENDPTAGLQGALTTPKVTPRAAITDPKEFGALLRAIDAYIGKPATRISLQLMALFFVRPGDLRLAEWREFDFDEAIWSIPASRMKMRRPHAVPLAPQAIEKFEELEAITGDGLYLFPSVRDENLPMSNAAMITALRTMGYSQEEMSAHGFRASASTLLNESGKWNPDAIERQLAHVEGNDVRRAYARGEYWNERVKMMTWWADYLDKLKNETPKP